MAPLSRRKAVKALAVAGGSLAASCRKTPAKESLVKTDTQPDPILQTGALGFPWATRDPFLFCAHHDDRYPKGNDRFGPAASLAGRQMGSDFEGIDGWRMYHGVDVPGFPQHPHRGFETVTIVRSGLLDHSDSLGAAARFGEGDVQWLTAGKGILHAEMFPLLHKDRENPVELFQIWLNLPRADKFVDPHFSMLWSQSIPRVTERDAQGNAVEIAVVAGQLQGKKALPPPPHSWAARSESDVSIWTIKLSPGAQWTLPAAAAGSNRRLYFFKGTGLQIGSRTISPSQFVDLQATAAVLLKAGAQEIELLLLQGKPIAESVVQYGPFVMSSREEIQQAFQDYQRTQFGGWPWQRHDPVHPREEGRFARHADGRIEKPA